MKTTVIYTNYYRQRDIVSRTFIFLLLFVSLVAFAVPLVVFLLASKTISGSLITTLSTTAAEASTTAVEASTTLSTTAVEVSTIVATTTLSTTTATTTSPPQTTDITTTTRFETSTVTTTSEVATTPSVYSSVKSTSFFVQTTLSQCVKVNVLPNLTITFNPNPNTPQTSPPFTITPNPDQVTINLLTPNLVNYNFTELILNMVNVDSTELTIGTIQGQVESSVDGVRKNYLLTPQTTNEIQIILNARTNFVDIVINEFVVNVCQ